MLINYFRYGSNVSAFYVLLAIFAISQLLANSADKWVSYWTKEEELRSIYGDGKLLDRTLLSTETCIYIHGGIIFCLMFAAWLRYLRCFQVALRASKTLHDGMFKSIITTTMRFFDTNPSGRILNRFAKDIGAIDEILPKAMIDASFHIFNMTGVIIIAVTINPFFLIPILILSFFFNFVRKVYLKSSKNVKRLEGISKLRHPHSADFLICFLFFSQISDIHALIGYAEWLIYYSSIRSTENFERRIRWTSRCQHCLLVYVVIHQRRVHIFIRLHGVRFHYFHHLYFHVH